MFKTALTIIEKKLEYIEGKMLENG